MPSPPRRRMPAAERRALIEDAARDLFAQRGYHATAIDAVARAAGVTPPVLYDHFDSKAALHVRLLERTRDELVAMWRGALPDGEPGPLSGERLERAFDAWARYVQDNPYAPRMFFRETTGIGEIAEAHARVNAEGLRALAGILGGLPPGVALADPRHVEMVAQIIRGGLTELAVWWAEHPEIPRAEIVAVGVATFWTGLERLGAA